MYFILFYKRQITSTQGRDAAAIAAKITDRAPHPVSEPSTLETTILETTTLETIGRHSQVNSQQIDDCLQRLDDLKQNYFLERRSFW